MNGKIGFEGHLFVYFVYACLNWSIEQFEEWFLWLLASPLKCTTDTQDMSSHHLL